MISFSEVSQANYVHVEFNVKGDDLATVLVINLAKPPFSLPFSGPLPTATVNTRSGNPATAAMVANGLGEAILTITFTAPPSSTVALGPLVTFNYASL